MIIVIVMFLTTARVIFNTETPASQMEHWMSSLSDISSGGNFAIRSWGLPLRTNAPIPISDPLHPTPYLLGNVLGRHRPQLRLPQLAGKTDVIPNRVNVMWIDPRHSVSYLGQCAQYCGTQHAKMLLRVYGQSQSDFDKWVMQQQKPANWILPPA